ncbi:MAG: hypothetical protein ACNA7M_08290 [Roseovarius sp.]
MLAKPHDDFVARGAADLQRLMVEGGVLFDIKAVFARSDSDLRL